MGRTQTLDGYKFPERREKGVTAKGERRLLRGSVASWAGIVKPGHGKKKKMGSK